MYDCRIVLYIHCAIHTYEYIHVFMKMYTSCWGIKGIIFRALCHAVAVRLQLSELGPNSFVRKHPTALGISVGH